MTKYNSKDVARVLLKKLGRRQVSAALLAVPLMTGCGAIYTPNPMHDGHIAVMADAKGMRSFMDGMNGMITNGKASPDQDTAHWIARKQEEQQVTIRQTSPGFLGGLFARPAAKQGGEQ